MPRSHPRNSHSDFPWICADAPHHHRLCQSRNSDHLARHRPTRIRGHHLGGRISLSQSSPRQQLRHSLFAERDHQLRACQFGPRSLLAATRSTRSAERMAALRPHHCVSVQHHQQSLDDERDDKSVRRPSSAPILADFRARTTLGNYGAALEVHACKSRQQVGLPKDARLIC